MQINDPVTVAEIRGCHDAYEAALIGNDVPVLDALFWDSPHAVRYGVTESLYGVAEVRAFRKARANIDLARVITRLEITTLGKSAGIVNLEFERQINGAVRHGRQTQFWTKFNEGWKIVSAHVSFRAASYVEMAAERIGLPIDPSLTASVTEDFQRISDIASFLMEFPLEQSGEAAPVFRA